MTIRFVLLALAIALAVAGSVSANENVRAVQEKLRDGGFYSGEIDGAFSGDLAAALTRYQIRSGLPITGQLDEETSKALGAKPAVTNDAADVEQSSAAWRRLRKGERQTFAHARETSSARSDQSGRTIQGEQSTPAAAPERAARPAGPPSEESAPVARQSADASKSSSIVESTERLRDYVAAFVLAGLDPHVGSEAEFFADRVQYYDNGTMGREKIREDLKRYDERWPERHFWLAGDIAVEPENGNRVRVTFPLRYELRNGVKHSSGKIDKAIVLQRTGDDLEIVAVNERKD